MQAQNQQDNSMDPIWLLFIIIAVIILIWIFQHHNIILAFSYIWRSELFVLQKIFDDINLVKIHEWLVAKKFKGTEFHEFKNIAGYIGSYTRWFWVPVMAGIIYYMYTKSPHYIFKRVYNMESLIKQVVKEWPQIAPVIDKKIIDQDPDKGEWRSAMTEWQFVYHYGLVPDFKDRLPTANDLDEEKAEKVFASQLGPLLTTYKNMAPHVKALVAMFSARVAGDNDSYNKLMRQLALSHANKKPDFSGVDEVVSKHFKHISHLLSKHAYQSTFLCSLLELARQKSGVLASADFIWLKPVDRTLWYALNDVGRRVSSVEAGGVRAHWLAERLAKRRLDTPIVQEAVRGLKELMGKIIAPHKH